MGVPQHIWDDNGGRLSLSHATALLHMGLKETDIFVHVTKTVAQVNIFSRNVIKPHLFHPSMHTIINYVFFSAG
jgi:hypothetical protein